MQIGINRGKGGSLAIGVAALIAAASSIAAARAEVMVAYLNEDGPRVSAAIERLEAALKRNGVAARHELRIEHFVIDHGDAPAITRTVVRAMSRGAAAIIATSGAAAVASMAATDRVPILFASHQDPVSLGLVDSIGRPGRNLTGFTFYQPVEMKRLEILREIAPGIRTLGLLVDESWRQDPQSSRFAIDAQRIYRISVKEFRADDVATLRASLAGRDARSMDAWYIPTITLPFAQPRVVAQAIASFRKPAIYTISLMAEGGGLVSYQPILEDPIETWATMLGMLLDGVPVAIIPVERPKLFELCLNLMAAKDQGMVIPVSLMQRAAKVYR